uniref:RING-type domain-containing protein n=1 Tax=Noctiluca scintillans TaxID=2966 RepID=A0A7S1F8W8_NOCSC|mmetsp:Transcript_43887/g.115921  ORF Transcript_43887/g.115921 Transcript_43887/m.115921 type:complete len:428 (+) Transcript_43887:120-1403(+)|eukprot:CAMPEP_0194514000 /NCGR_PEP_ID=MMETSP0253-20130528/46326_1 /TAXON_ID=2966 /ORGANISM="Noctiluca scintillans" /LENGTH=427 /DNA_ID=CAMNT_0039357605 /DNA_START=75 /DNA_END=1358 /DNA_ORIENTATION=+
MPRGLIPEAFVQQSELVVWSEDIASTCLHDRCAICQECFSAGVPDICRVLDCSHVFHAKCVDLWFIKATFCPLCKNDFKSTLRKNLGGSSSSLGRSSHSSSARSLGSRSYSSSLRSGQILVGHSNSDPSLLGILHPGMGHLRGSPPHTPDRQHASVGSLPLSFSDRSLPLMGQWGSERSLGVLSASSSGVLPAVQEVSDEARSIDDTLLSFESASHASDVASPLSRSRGLRPPVAANEQLNDRPAAVAVATGPVQLGQTIVRSFQPDTQVSPNPSPQNQHRLIAVPIYVPAGSDFNFVGGASTDAGCASGVSVSVSSNSVERPETPCEPRRVGASGVTAIVGASSVMHVPQTRHRAQSPQAIASGASGVVGVVSVTHKTSHTLGSSATQVLASNLLPERRRVPYVFPPRLDVVPSVPAPLASANVVS